jgi:O-antigen ligase
MNGSIPSPATKKKVTLPVAILCFSLGFWVSDFSASLSNKGKFQYIPLVLLVLFCVYQFNLGNLKTIDFSYKYLWLLLYLTYGTVGILIGKLYFGSVNGPLPLVLPFIILCFSVVRFQNSIPTQSDLKLLSILCLVGNTLVVITRLKVLPFLDLFQFSHENSYLLPLALGSALIAKSNALFVLNTIIGLLMFRVYPAGTYLLTLFIIGIFFVLPLLKNFRRVLLLTISMLWIVESFFIYQITFQFGQVIGNSNAFFAFLGKADNSLYRKLLSDQLLIYFQERPLLGFGFTGEILVLTRFSAIPAHNDYLTILVAGGILGLTLFLLMIYSIQLDAIRKITRVSEIDRKILLTLMCTVNVYTVSMSINPLGMKTFNSLLLIGCLFWMRSISDSYD